MSVAAAIPPEAGPQAPGLTVPRSLCPTPALERALEGLAERQTPDGPIADIEQGREFGRIAQAPDAATDTGLDGLRGGEDAADAEAICEAAQRPTMRMVAVKTEEQQARGILPGPVRELSGLRT